MSLGGPTGVGAIPGGLPQQQVPLARLAQAGWIEGRVIATPADGGARIATFLGIVAAPEAGAGLMPGDPVRLRLNPQTGKIEAQLARAGAGGAPAGGVLSSARPSEQAPGQVVAPMAATAPHLPSAALAGLAPVLPGPASALGAALPAPGAALYGLIATLFPGGAPPRPRGRTAPRKAAAGTPGNRPEAEEGAEGAPLAPLDPPEPVSRDPLDVIEWQAPVTEDADPPQDEVAREEAPPAAPPAAPPLAMAGQLARLAGQLPGGGMVHLDARRLGDLITLEVRSDTPLPSGIARLIRRQAEALALAWGARLACSFRVVPHPS